MYQKNKSRSSAGVFLSLFILSAAVMVSGAEQSVKICAEDEVVEAFGGESYSLIFDADANLAALRPGYNPEFYLAGKVYKKTDLKVKMVDEQKVIYQIGTGEEILTVSADTDISLMDHCILTADPDSVSRHIYNLKGELLLSYADYIGKWDPFYYVWEYHDRLVVAEECGTGYQLDFSENAFSPKIMFADLSVMNSFPEYGETRMIGDRFYIEDGEQHYIICQPDGEVCGEVNYVYDECSGYWVDDVLVLQDENMNITAQIPRNDDLVYYYGYYGNIAIETPEKTYYIGQVYPELHGCVCTGSIPYGQDEIPCAQTEDGMYICLDGETGFVPAREGEVTEGFNDSFMITSFEKEGRTLYQAYDLRTGNKVIPADREVFRYELRKSYIVVMYYDADQYRTSVYDRNGIECFSSKNGIIRAWTEETLRVNRGAYYGFTDLNGNWIGKTLSPREEHEQ